jgi:hypothetical protein
MVAAIDDYLGSVPADVLPPEIRDVLLDTRDRLESSRMAVGLRYFRNYVPIRFVQFVDDMSQFLSDQRLQHGIGLANQIFFPARMRFFLRENIAVLRSDFTYLYLRDENDELILDDRGRRQHDWYTWPDELWQSPLLWPLYWPQVAYWPQIAQCPALERPEPTAEHPDGNVEPRYYAQMRASAYCARDGEMLVYINQGSSNGGQYPWYSRLIGMTSGHMTAPGEPRNRFTFPHEVGHFFGLPHTFPNHNNYSIDYDLARMIGSRDEGHPEPWERRFYTTHDALVDPETKQAAKLSLFWDLVFKPIFSMNTPTQHLFFDDREEAAQWEADLQPIQEWSNGHLCLAADVCCGETSPSTRLELKVGAGCRGVEGDFSDCLVPAEPFCTGQPAVAAFSRPASDPDKIHLNVMSYGYRRPDGSKAPDDVVEMVFLSGSQLEQLDRVLTHDVETLYPGRFGGRPEMGSCSRCHPQSD